MRRWWLFLIVSFLCVTKGVESFASEAGYICGQSIQNVIALETQQISETHPADYDELAQLYVSRAESHLLLAEYEKAVEDFEKASSYIQQSRDVETALIVMFRAAFGEAVCYDNLGMHENTQRVIQQLQSIVGYFGCEDYFSRTIDSSSNTLDYRDLVTPCKNKKDKQPTSQPQQQNDTYDDILGPTEVDQNWCEETVTGVARVMDGIAACAPHIAVKLALIGVIEALLVRGIKCCETGGFWKACVGPITRKWREWKEYIANNKYPDTENWPIFFE